MKDKGCSGIYCLLTAANIFGLFAIITIAVVIGTDRWIKYDVDRSKLNSADQMSSNTGITARYYHTRHNGMFRECYPGNDTSFLEKAADVVDKNCFMLHLGDNIAGATTEYQVMNGLFTAFVAAFLLAVLLLIIAYIIGLVLCFRNKYTLAWLAALVSFLSVFFIALGFALFHGSVHVGNEQVHDSLPGRSLYPPAWPKSLQNVTLMSFAESYIGGWVAFVLAIITCAFYIGIVCNLPRRQKSVNKAQEHAQYQQQQNVLYPMPTPQQPLVYYLTN